MLIIVASLKGGVGKTTTALHLAAALTPSGATLLVDADANRTASDWARRNLDHPPAFGIVDEQQAQTAGYPHVIIDSAGHLALDRLLPIAHAADVVLVPTTPDAFSGEMTLKTARALGAAPVRVLLTIVPPRPSTAADEMRAELKRHGLAVCKAQIPRRVAFQHAAANGVTLDRWSKTSDGWLAYAGLAKELLR